jgi:Flp pilus assembly pilin Flp
MLGILQAAGFLKLIPAHLDLRGNGTTSRSNKNMMNIVEKYSAEGTIEGEEGVVAIEYVITAAALVIALVALWAAFGTVLSAKLNEIVGNVGNGSAPTTP